MYVYSKAKRHTGFQGLITTDEKSLQEIIEKTKTCEFRKGIIKNTRIFAVCECFCHYCSIIFNLSLYPNSFDTSAVAFTIRCE